MDWSTLLLFRVGVPQDGLRIIRSADDPGALTNSATLFSIFTALSLAYVSLMAILDSATLVGIARVSVVARITNFLHRPFCQFLTLDDLAQFGFTTVPRLEPSVWKRRAINVAFVLQLVLAIGQVVLALSEGLGSRSIFILIAGCVSWVYVFAKSLVQRKPTVPYWLICFILLNLITSIFGIFRSLSTFTSPSHPALISIYAISVSSMLIILAILATYPMQHILPAPNVALASKAECIPSSDLSSPEDSVTLWNWITFDFMEPILQLASKRTLQIEDVWDLPPTFKHANIFGKYLEVQKEHPQSLLWFLLSSNSLDLIIDVALKMWYSVAGFVPAYCLSRILASLEDHSPGNKHYDAYTFAFITFLVHMSTAQSDLFRQWHSRRAYERTRGQLFCLLHWKALKGKDLRGRISESASNKSGEIGMDVGSDVESNETHLEEKNAAEGQTTGIGRITNLMSGDSYAVAQRFWEFSSVLTAPVRLAIALIFLYSVLGWSSFMGVLVVLLAYIVTWPLAKWNIAITRSSWEARDYRMSLVNELIQSIRFLKFTGWESHWTQKVKAAREIELSWRVKENIVSTILGFIWAWLPSAVILAAFYSYTMLAGEPLTVSKAFVSIAVFTRLKGPMEELPTQIFALLHAYVSLQRIESYLQEGEVEDWATTLKREECRTPYSLKEASKVWIRNGTFAWHAVGGRQDGQVTFNTPDSPRSVSVAKEFILSDISVDFPPGTLSLVTGPTGSGKSSLLSALLGEMDRVSGTLHLMKGNRNVSYAGQFPFLENATIRDNIVYHQPFEMTRYHEVLEACALLPDLRILDAGDQTEIGEKGVSLSGGQRARVALARAIYARSKVVLLDDSLAAVDMHTARHLFNHCLNPRAKLTHGRTIILVTHHVSLCLPAASYLVELGGGQVIKQGPVEELRKSGILDVAEEDDLSVTPREDPPSLVPDDSSETVDGDENEVSFGSGTLVDEETRAEGRVSVRTYLLYIRSAGWLSWVLTFLLLVFIRAVGLAEQLYIAKWAGAYRDTTNRMDYVIKQIGFGLPTLPSPSSDPLPWLLLYLTITLTGALAVLLNVVIGYWAGLRASRSLFISMLDRVVRAPTRIFDKTPIGRILNRFVADVGAIDNALNESSRNALRGTLEFIISFGIIVIIVPRFTLLAMFIAFLYIRIAPPFVRAARDLRRLESISLSPAFAGFDELLHGLPHVRAYATELIYQNRFYSRVDKFQTMDHVYWLAQMWIKWRYDVLGSFVVFLTTLFALVSGVHESLAAIVIIQAGIFAEASRQLVKVLAQAELDFNSVERIKDYLELDQEAPARCSPPPPARWPSSHGGITFENLVIRYAPHLPPALKGVSFTIHSHEKIGVVGRTGSGKSTLALSLLRILEASEGRIILDGVDISKVGLDDLRDKLTIVSQDVALFSGTVRSNLDPFSEHTDAECWDVLERCQLGTSIRAGTPRSTHAGVVKSLDMKVSSGGSSFAAGQRQLLALARAMLRRSAFVILDEASSSIDLVTDNQIQRTIREELADSLVITIAHRLKTIIDYDRVLVLGNGEILQYDTPQELFARGGAFRDMCEESADWEELRQAFTAAS
ncbi:uncharacterized protein EI90DRAFT_3030312 [Cantharellus anzutake]|uniref:uncharacterized protein n=1 Tax=Cantharellus anzutake TaxID=1750568 RepID=UPI0019060C39|nr:uncharacterized protein EI90DRAFT_3030312 [Cantharellus anzutake]KAF8342804.1 hypothetical protein EI90DRAFT_3030312 [Cantharellus anzutake]